MTKRFMAGDLTQVRAENRRLRAALAALVDEVNVVLEQAQADGRDDEIQGDFRSIGRAEKVLYETTLQTQRRLT